MKFPSIPIRESSTLVGVLLLAIGLAHAQEYSGKDETMQKPGDSKQYPDTSLGSSGTSETDQRKGYDNASERKGGQYDSQGYGKDSDSDLYDWSGTDGTGPKLKGRY